MSDNFLKFKRKSKLSRILKAMLYGLSAGLFASGLSVLLSKLDVVDLDYLLCAAVGAAAFAAVFIILFFVLRKSDARLARELDARFGLEERVETMLAYKDEPGAMAGLQRDDTNRILGRVRIKRFKMKRLWICFIALAAGAAMLTASILVPAVTEEKPKEEEVPFELSEYQRKGLSALIEYVASSEMEEPYRGEIKDELSALLSELEEIKTQTKMQAALGESMAFILQITSDSSSMTEIANELWDTEDEYARSLAELINTSSWKEPDWGDYAEKYVALRALYDYEKTEGEGEPTDEELLAALKWKLDNSSVLKIATALSQSGIPSDDIIYSSISVLLDENSDGAEGPILGFKYLPGYIEDEGLTYEESVVMLDRIFDYVSEDIFNAISVKKVNTNVGEYAMTKLSTFFLVPLPGFERPDFVKGSGSSSDGEEDDDKDENESEGGGIGTGDAYGSNDYVLDPLTGEYVKYGTLLAKYYAVMSAKLESGAYSEAQKEAITKYFELLYSGIKKDEGK